MKKNEVGDILLQLVVCEPVHWVTGCFEWPGYVDEGGYGRVGLGGRAPSVHRVVFAHFRGRVPAGWHVHHWCENRRCCNPDHLEAMPASEHLRLEHALRSACDFGEDYRDARRARCPICEEELRIAGQSADLAAARILARERALRRADAFWERLRG